MKANLGNTDKIIRLVISAIIAVLFFTNVISGTVGIIMLVVAGVLLLTSFVSFCPLYWMLGLRSLKSKNE